MSKSKVSTKRIIKLYKKHDSVAEVSRIVGRHYTSVWQRLKRAGVIGK